MDTFYSLPPVDDRQWKEMVRRAQKTLEKERSWEEQLRKEIPCRERPIKILLALLGKPKNIVPDSIYIYGLPASGKTYVTSRVLTVLDYKRVIVDCVENYTSRLLFESILTGLSENEEVSCRTMYDFINFLQEAMATPYFKENAFIIVLDNCDRLRNMESTLLPAFLCLSKLAKVNVCVILISILTFDRFHLPGGLDNPVEVFFPQYTKDEMLTVVCAKHKWKDQFDALFTNYVRLFLSVFFISCRDLSEISHMVNSNFLKHCDPIISGKVGPNKLWTTVLPFFKTLGGELYLRMLPSDDTGSKVSKLLQQVNPERSALTFELPFYSKFFLIAAFLASYSPQKLDRALFVKQSEKKYRKTKRILRTYDDVAADMLLGPKAFTADRLLAIFYAIVDGEVNFTANICAQIPTLVKLQLLTAESNTLECQRYRCAVGLDFITTIGKTVGVDVRKYIFPPK